LKDRNIEGLSAQLKEMQNQLLAIEREKSGGDSFLDKEEDYKLNRKQQEYSDMEFTLKERDAIFRSTKETLERTLEELHMRKLEIVQLRASLSGVEFSASRVQQLMKEEQELNEEVMKRQKAITDLSNRYQK
jgi:hypothetical protein